jgi:hypothetical protein
VGAFAHRALSSIGKQAITKPDTDGFGELSLDGLKLALAVQIFYTTMAPDYYRAFQRFAFAC